METYYLTKQTFAQLLKSLLENYSTYVPFKKGDFLFYQRLTSDNLEDIVIDTNRAIHSIKSFFLPPQEKVSDYFGPENPVSEPRKAIVGVKACDLKALKILDSVYASRDFGDFEDSGYLKKRKQTLIISSDCLEPDENCFCTNLRGTPYPKEGFDLNLSSVAGGFVVEPGSEKGEKIIQEQATIFREAKKPELEEREKNRQRVSTQVKKNNQEFQVEKPYREIVKDSYGCETWSRYAETCVDCGGCNEICPTCRCFLLHDGKKGEQFERTRLWDACLLTGFARVAAGANPRPHLHQRFSNRLFCKLYFFPQNINLDACTGCGRCIAVCIGKIDMRKVIKDLEQETKVSAIKK